MKIALITEWAGYSGLTQEPIAQSGGKLAGGAFISLVGFSRPFRDELLGIVVLAKLTAGVFPNSRGVRVSPV